MKEGQFPQACMECLAREFDDEILVYDLQHDLAHCLNLTAGATWKLCDGNNSPSQIAMMLSRQFSTQVDESVVFLALAQLADAHLLVEPVMGAKRLSRRVALRRIGIATAIALPLVTSIVAPTPAHAASCLPNGAHCTSPAQCCSHLCGIVTGICGNILSPNRPSGH